MKRTIIAIAIAVGVTTLLAIPVFAGNEEMAGRHADTSDKVVLDTSHCGYKGAGLPTAEHIALVKSCLAEASAPANVKLATLQEKKSYCNQNSKNKALQGSEKEHFLTACMNSNEALLQFALVNRGIASTNSDIAEVDISTLRQPPAGDRH